MKARKEKAERKAQRRMAREESEARAQAEAEAREATDAAERGQTSTSLHWPCFPGTCLPGTSRGSRGQSRVGECTTPRTAVHLSADSTRSADRGIRAPTDRHRYRRHRRWSDNCVGGVVELTVVVDYLAS